MQTQNTAAGVGKQSFPHPSKVSRAPSKAETQPSGRLLVLPRPLLTNPVDVYLARLAPSSTRTLRKLLRRIAGLAFPGRDEAAVPWHRLCYPDTLEIRRQLTEIYAPATCQLALAALRGVLREAWRLGQLSHEDYQRAIDLPAVRGTCHRLQPAISQKQIERLFSASSERLPSFPCLDFPSTRCPSLVLSSRSVSSSMTPSWLLKQSSTIWSKA